MKKVEVLVACMNQRDDSLYDEMNLKTDAVFGNQCDGYSYNEYHKNRNTLKIVSTKDRGVGKNRNNCILYAQGDYLIFADDDMVYEHDYEEAVISAFNKIPQADIIVFDLEYLNTIFKGKKRKIKKIHRLHFFNSMRYGAARIAVKRESLIKNNVWFSLLYGGGAPYSSGEDSLFIREALRKNMRIYAYPKVIAKVKQEKSSWFMGFNDKYYRDKGVLIANMFPIIKYVMLLYFTWRLRKTSEKYSMMRIFKLMREGLDEFNKGIKL